MTITQTTHERLADMLTSLKLTAIRDQLDRLLSEVARQDLALPDALAMLCERELGRKHERRIEMGLSIAKFPAVCELASFDCKAQPSLDAKQIKDLASSRWVGLGETVLLLGPPGVGKTHLAIGLGRAAVGAGYSVLFTQATSLVAGLAKAHAEGRLDDRLMQLSKPKLLIIDELGYLPFEPNAAHLFFQLVSRRYERGSMMITSNRAVGELGHGVRRSGGRHRHPRPHAAPQPRRHDPRRQLPAEGETQVRPRAKSRHARSVGRGRRGEHGGRDQTMTPVDQFFVSPADQFLMSLDTCHVRVPERTV